jgi:hypothetical protein
MESDLVEYSISVINFFTKYFPSCVISKESSNAKRKREGVPRQMLDVFWAPTFDDMFTLGMPAILTMG